MKNYFQDISFEVQRLTSQGWPYITTRSFQTNFATHGKSGRTATMLPACSQPRTAELCKRGYHSFGSNHAASQDHKVVSSHGADRSCCKGHQTHTCQMLGIRRDIRRPSCCKGRGDNRVRMASSLRFVLDANIRLRMAVCRFAVMRLELALVVHIAGGGVTSVVASADEAVMVISVIIIGGIPLAQGISNARGISGFSEACMSNVVLGNQ